MSSRIVFAALMLCVLFANVVSSAQTKQSGVESVIKKVKNTVTLKKSEHLVTDVDVDDKATADDVFIPYVARQVEASPTPCPTNGPRFCFPEYTGTRNCRVLSPRNQRTRRQFAPAANDVIKFIAVARTRGTTVTVILRAFRRRGDRNRRIRRFGVRLYPGSFAMTRANQARPLAWIPNTNDGRRFRVTKDFSTNSLRRPGRRARCCGRTVTAAIFMRMCLLNPIRNSNCRNGFFTLPFTLRCSGRRI